jgi:hypothetical protein
MDMKILMICWIVLMVGFIFGMVVSGFLRGTDQDDLDENREIIKQMHGGRE